MKHRWPNSVHSQVEAVFHSIRSFHEEKLNTPLGTPIDEMILSDDFGKDVVLVKMIGTSMEPIIREGDVFAVDNGITSFSSGQIFVVWIPLDGPVVRRVFIDFEKLILKAENQSYPEMIIPIAEIPKDNFILGKVVWALHSL